jgi:hypothetical protein
LPPRFDEVFPPRTVAKGAHGAAPEARQSQGSGLDDYLSRNRTTGLLLLKGDTILAERYQGSPSSIVFR